jgi:excinuclease ABC subunit B
VDDLLNEIHDRAKDGQRVLVTTLTKRMAEDLTEYYCGIGLKVRYLHSDITTLDRWEIIRDLRLGCFDVLVGVNLLREGLDLPEVGLVAVLDADREGFLRSQRSLIQTCGRAARNIHGKVLMYAEAVTRSMKLAIEETERRREIQKEFNKKNNITPRSIEKDIQSALSSIFEADYYTVPKIAENSDEYVDPAKIPGMIKKLKKEMKATADRLNFERAAELRDRIKDLEKMELAL